MSRPASSAHNLTIDVAKGIGIVLVLYGHALEVFFIVRSDGMFSSGAFLQWKTLYAFHMPLFFMLSGLVSPRLGQDDLAKQVARSIFLVATACVVNALGGIAEFALAASRGEFELYPVFRGTLAALIRGEDYKTTVPWFLTSLAITQFVCYCAFRFKAMGWLLLAGVVLLSVAIMAFTSRNFWQIRTLPAAIVFFLIGHVLARRGTTVSSRGKLALTGLVLAGLTITAAPMNHGCAWSFEQSCPNILSGEIHQFGVWLKSGSLGYLPLFAATALAGAFAVWTWSIALADTPLAKPLGWLGTRSLELMIFNGFALAFLNPYWSQFTWPSPARMIFEASLIVLMQVWFIWIVGAPIAQALSTFKRKLELAVRQALPLPLGG